MSDDKPTIDLTKAEQPRYGAVNATRQDHINRLRTRCRNASGTNPALAGVLMGILDLLADDGV
jgi:hypothetical protein